MPMLQDLKESGYLPTCSPPSRYREIMRHGQGHLHASSYLATHTALLPPTSWNLSGASPLVNHRGHK